MTRYERLRNSDNFDKRWLRRLSKLARANGVVRFIIESCLPMARRCTTDDTTPAVLTKLG